MKPRASKEKVRHWLPHGKALRDRALYRNWRSFRRCPEKANSAFGTRSIFNGQPRNAHSGADFPSLAGTPIKAPAPGKVVIADDFYFSGGTVVIDHGLGIVSLFAHMSQILVKAGDDVARGRGIGSGGRHGAGHRPTPALDRSRERRPGGPVVTCGTAARTGA